MNFVTIGDKKYFHMIDFSLKQIKKYYPDSEIILYDWGFDSGQAEHLEVKYGATVINWQGRIPDAKSLVSFKPTIKNFCKKYIFRWPDFRINSERWNRELLLDEKCYCLLDASIRASGQFLFLDGDAFIINNIDEIIAAEYDIIVTLRPIQEIKEAKKRGDRHDINSGVIYFGKYRLKTVSFIIEWIKEMQLMNLIKFPLSEQTGLSELILRHDHSAFSEHGKVINIRLSGQDIKCKIVPTDNYNYNSIENGFNPAINRILHLKKGRGFEINFDNLVQEINSKAIQ